MAAAQRRTLPSVLLLRLQRSKTALLGLTIVLVVIASALLAGYLAPHDPTAQNLSKRLLPPFWMSGNMEYLLGTDPLGRDILSRIIYGSRISLLVGLCSVAISGTIGVFLGLLSGYYGGRADSFIMRLADIQLGVPFLVLAIAVVAMLQPGLRNIIIVLGLTGWVLYGRIVRGEVLSVKEREFVEAARAIGAQNHRIIRLHILPNVSTSIIVVGTLQVAHMIIAEASLSFLGLGVQPPTPTWGGMVADGRDYLALAWWVSTVPGVAIFLTVLGINLLGDWLRDSLDPTLKL
ncbi:MAG: ABC transporter permease [Chloroflexi bacterium]|nr:ABC transporter permease [Chloroflexota bacterium]MCL5075256.1 ABC transporter permease [Chloroflexota bacterium]